MLKLKQDCERMVKLLWVLGSLAYQFPGFPFFWFIGLPDTWVSSLVPKNQGTRGPFDPGS